MAGQSDRSDDAPHDNALSDDALSDDAPYTEEFLASRTLHRDGMVLIIDKPAGIATHAPQGGGRAARYLDQYFNALRFGLPRPPALAHRLDRDTTGCLVLGRHPKALRRLANLFREGRIDKTYLAVCRGAPSPPLGAVTAPLAKETGPRGARMTTTSDAPGAFPAHTDYRTLATRDALSLVEASPRTGRTHQIRVHLAHLGAPIVGDRLYGSADDGDAMQLHAWRIVIPLSNKKPPIDVVAPPPPSMAAAIARFGLAGRFDAPVGGSDRDGA